MRRYGSAVLTKIPSNLSITVNSLACSYGLPFSFPVTRDQESVWSKSLAGSKSIFFHHVHLRAVAENNTIVNLERYRLDRCNSDMSIYTTSNVNGSLMGNGKPNNQSPSRKARLGLNIITDFQSNGKQALSDNVVIDTVAANRPQIAHRSFGSVKSAKAEAVFEVSTRQAASNSNFVSLNDITANRTSKKRKGNKGSNKAQTISKPNDFLQETGDRPSTARSILIGFSVPRNEVAAHKQNSDGNTSRTPSILITPAEVDSPWSSTSNNGREGRGRRPSSSIYSQADHDMIFIADDDAPPVPKLNGALLNDLQHGPLNLKEKSEFVGRSDNGIRTNRTSFETIIDDNESDGLYRRGSSDSQVLILPGEGENTRPQSKGWWNLMLSPMLSRAGTLASRKGPWSPTREAFPAALQNHARDIENVGITGNSAHDDQVSFEQVMSSSRVGDSSLAETQTYQQAEVVSSHGLAAEYYHACAVDKAIGGQFFECVNHSCAEKCPKLGFVALDMPGAAVSREIPATPKIFPSVNDDLDLGRSPPVFSPNVRQANIVPVVKTIPINAAPSTTEALTEGALNNKPVDGGFSDYEVANPMGRSVPYDNQATAGWPAATHKTGAGPEVPARNADTMPSISTVLAPSQHPAVPSPAPVSPEATRVIAPPGAVPMGEVWRPIPVSENHGFSKSETRYPAPYASADALPGHLYERDQSEEPQSRKQRDEKEENSPKKPGKGVAGFLCCLGRKGNKPAEKDAGRSKKKKWYIGVGTGLLILTITCIILAIELTRKGDGTPVQSQWLNLTGFPPLPTGISTIIRPDVTNADSSCVQPSAMWSCAIPKEAQWSVAPNDPDQPNFRIEIRFRNGTLPSNETQPIQSLILTRSRLFSRTSMSRRQSDPFTNDLFTPNPAPPSIAEQIFLGNTTDNITIPFQGETTPFYITFLPTQPIVPSAFDTNGTSLSRRQTSSLSNDTKLIPPPSINADGTATPANLLPTSPYPFSQPLRLYNRGQATEHYGFYTYFDRSIFLHSDSPLNSSSALANVDSIPANGDGGSPRSSATMRCTWSQTRFLVKIWTNPIFGATLLGPQYNLNDPPPGSNSATDYTPPGSFPYPVTVTLDRHGGDLHSKGIYCYGMSESIIITTDSAFVPEDRSSGGVAVNPAPPLIELPSDDGDDGDGFNPDLGGIDGGTGGCGCSWQNWVGGT